MPPREVTFSKRKEKEEVNGDQKGDKQRLTYNLNDERWLTFSNEHGWHG